MAETTEVKTTTVEEFERNADGDVVKKTTTVTSTTTRGDAVEGELG